MEAAKRKTLWLLWIASAILLSLPTLASSVDVFHAKTRAELPPENGQFSVEPWTLNPVNATRNYDWLREAASDSPVAPISGGKTVLGHYPAYTELAEQLGARRFNIPTSVWKKMSEAERWAANTKFLDRMIARGDDVILATRADLAKPGSYFERELEYLLTKGFKISEDGLRLIAPGVR